MDNQSLSHSQYNCTYYIVFIPKYRRKVMFGNLGKEVGEAISKVCRMEGVTIIKVATVTRPCAYVCLNSSKRKCVENGRKNQRKEQFDAFRQTSRISRAIQGKIAKINQVTRGWITYYAFGSMKTAMAEIDAHLRTRLRVIIWKQWKVPKKRQWGLQKLGIEPYWAKRTSQWGDHYQFVATRSCLKQAVSKEVLAKAGLVSCLDYYNERHALKFYSFTLTYKKHQVEERRMTKKALITGVTGQDGSYLSELLLEKGYEVHGMIRRSSVDYRERIAHLEGNSHFHLHYGDLSDSMSLMQVIGLVRPDEIYNLAAQSHVQVSFDVPEYTADVVAVGVLRILEAVRLCGLTETCRIYQASTSELFGKVEEVPQKETTPFHPYSPYAVAKQYGFWIVKEYREAYNMFCCSGILFNHESERRGETFVTRKITLAAARIAQGKQDKLYLGNLSSLRDWGYAKDYVECMWLILQNDKPEDYVIATGEQHSVREFATLAFHYAGIEIEWKGEGIGEHGIDVATGRVLVEVSPDFYRPTDVVNLWGDPTKAKTELGWNPTKTNFEELVKIMVDHDMKKVAVERAEEHIKMNLEEYLEKGVVK